MVYDKLEQFTAGTVFFQERQYVGFVSFKVLSNDGEVVHAKSLNESGYDFELTEESLGWDTNNGNRIHDTLESIVHGTHLQDEQSKTTYVDGYRNNKDSFVEDMIKKAYVSANDAEYGNYVESLAIKELASIHFPGLDL